MADELRVPRNVPLGWSRTFPQDPGVYLLSSHRYGEGEYAAGYFGIPPHGYSVRGGIAFVEAHEVRRYALIDDRWLELPAALNWGLLARLLHERSGELGLSAAELNALLTPPPIEWSATSELRGSTQGEFSAIQARLAKIEQRLEGMAAAPKAQWQGKRYDPGEIQFEKVTKREDAPNPEGLKRSDVKAPVINLDSIASAVQASPVTDTSTWKTIAGQYPGVELFGIDADARSFEISQDGSFDGRAEILISVPRGLQSGRTAKVSIAIPARVYGQLSPTGDVSVAEFRISQEPSQ